MASELIQLSLNDGEHEGTVKEMQAKVRKPVADGPVLPIRAIVILPSLIAQQLDEAGIRKVIEEQVEEKFDELRTDVKRMQRLVSCIENQSNIQWIELVAKDMGFPDILGPDGEKKASGAYNLCRYINHVAATDKANGSETLPQKYERRKLLLANMDNSVKVYLERVAINKKAEMEKFRQEVAAENDKQDTIEKAEMKEWIREMEADEVAMREALARMPRIREMEDLQIQLESHLEQYTKKIDEEAAAAASEEEEDDCWACGQDGCEPRRAKEKWYVIDTRAPAAPRPAPRQPRTGCTLYQGKGYRNGQRIREPYAAHRA